MCISHASDNSKVSTYKDESEKRAIRFLSGSPYTLIWLSFVQVMSFVASNTTSRKLVRSFTSYTKQRRVSTSNLAQHTRESVHFRKVRMSIMLTMPSWSAHARVLSCEHK